MTKRNCRFWTEDDDILLLSMAAAGKSITLMTVKFGRPIRVIKSRAQELHIALPGEDKNTKRWVGAQKTRQRASRLVRCGRCNAVRGTLEELHDLARRGNDVFEFQSARQ